MTSIRVKFRPSSVAGQEGSIYYQIIHGRKVRQIGTEYKIRPSEWDEKHARPSGVPNTDRERIIASIREHIRCDIDRLKQIEVKFAGREENYTADDVVAEFERQITENTLYNYMEKIIAKFKGNGRYTTACHYRATLNSFKRFRDNADIMLDELNSDTMEAYQAWLQQNGLIPNSISFYMRILRAVYKRAIEDEIVEDYNPFKHVYTGVDKTVKRALPLNIIRKIKSLDLSAKPRLAYARDIFILSFLLRGMSFIDMCYLRKDNLKYGVLSYRRRKTGQLLSIAWKKEMQSILDKYPPNPTDYLLPIITRPGAVARNVYLYMSYRINQDLKKIAKLANIQFPLTLYVARHSWASVAKAKGIPLSVISEGMGHDSEATTQIYLSSLDSSIVDKANAEIIKALK